MMSLPFCNRSPRLLNFATALVVLALTAAPAFAATAGEARVMGPEDESKQISVTVWLKPHNKPALDAAVAEMYEKGSATYHHFLTRKQLSDQYGPTSKDVGVVREYLASHNMTVVMTDQDNHFVIAKTRVGDAQSAFNVKINKVMVNGEAHHANASEAKLTGPAADVVATVQGLSDLKYQTNVKRSTDPDTGKPRAGVPYSAVHPNGIIFSSNCLRAPESEIFSTNGGLPEAFYAGNRFGANITSDEPGELPPCGYDADEMQEAYGLKTLYARGLNGTGQTIVIVDAYGSNSILADANLFSQLNNLPPLTSSNFAEVYPTGPVTCTATNGCIAGNWQYETTLDVEWAHAIAPNANIVLVAAADNSFTNLDLANLAAIENQYGSVLSNSFGISEIVLQDFDPAELVVENGISEIAAALGISQDVSSGDDGDELAVDNNDYGINATSVQSNADSPYATAVGGTSTFLDEGNHIKLQTGWGLNFTRIANPKPNPPTIPPLNFGFQSGSGGGASTYFAKPKFQKKLPGSFRQVPDIAMNADPETGVEIVVSPDGNQADGIYIEGIGGTSLACPMFSAVWAIANQAAGGGPIGDAAPILYELPQDAIVDVNVTAAETALNVSGIIIDATTGPTYESPADLAGPLENNSLFISALYQSDTSTRWDVFTFGTDSSLFTAPGWDNVTGLGTPNGAKFVDRVVLAVQ